MESRSGLAQHQRPRFDYLHHISLPCRDVEESKRFYTQVLGGELIHDIPGFAEVRIAENYRRHLVAIRRLDGAGGGVLPLLAECRPKKFCAGPPLARRMPGASTRLDAELQSRVLYFRDPSGHLIELYWDSGYEDIRELASRPVGTTPARR